MFISLYNAGMHFLLRTEPSCDTSLLKQSFVCSRSPMQRLSLWTHINGSLSCSDILPSSFWGCEHSGWGNDKLTTLVTFKNKTRLLPASVSSDSCNPSYSIHGVGLNSSALSFEPFDIPLAVAVNDSFQIWVQPGLYGLRGREQLRRYLCRRTRIIYLTRFLVPIVTNINFLLTISIHCQPILQWSPKRNALIFY